MGHGTIPEVIQSPSRGIPRTNAIDRAAPGDVAPGENVGPGSLFERLCARYSPTKYPAGRMLFRQDDFADAIYYVGSGRLHRTITTKRGDERLVTILGPGDFCGEDCLGHTRRRTTSAVVVEDAKVVRIERTEVDRLRRGWPDFADAFMSFLLTHGLGTEAALIDHLVGSVEQRLGRVLMKLANAERGACSPGTILNVKQDMLARLVGTTRPRVNYFLTKFRRLGLIDYGGALKPGSIKVSNRLGQVCDGE